MIGSRGTMKLGDILLNEGIISKDQLNKALKEQKTSPEEPLGSILVRLGYIDGNELARIFGTYMNVKSVDLEKVRQIPPSLLELINERLCSKHKIFPFGYDSEKDTLHIACIKPDKEITNDIEKLTGRKVILYVAPANQVIERINEFPVIYNKYLTEDYVLSLLEDGDTAYLLPANPICIIKDGNTLQEFSFPKLSDASISKIATSLLSVASLDKVVERGYMGRMCYKSGGKYKVIVLYQRNNYVLMVSKVPEKIPKVSIPSDIGTVLSEIDSGVIFISGREGAGKTVLLSYIIEAFNQNSVMGILTLHDLVEYPFHNKKSIIYQFDVDSNSPLLMSILRTVHHYKVSVVAIDINNLYLSPDFSEVIDIIQKLGQSKIVILTTQSEKTARSLCYTDTNCIHIHIDENRKLILREKSDEKTLESMEAVN